MRLNRVKMLRAALEEALSWHESEDKALSKSGRRDLDYRWQRSQHFDRIETIKEVLEATATKPRA